MKKGCIVGDDVRRLKTPQINIRPMNGARLAQPQQLRARWVAREFQTFLCGRGCCGWASRAPFIGRFILPGTRAKSEPAYVVYLVLMLLFMLFTRAAHAETNEFTGMMQKALFEEEGNHNLTAAIQGYQNIITRFDESRALTATAVFRLGECYRKQGKTNEASAQYQRIVRDFG